MKKIIMSLFALFILLISFQMIKNNGDTRAPYSGQIYVILEISNTDTTEITIDFLTGDKLLDLLINNIEIEYVHYLGIGNMITKIGDIEQGNGKYILIYVNGEFSNLGIDRIIILDGMVITFKLS